MGGAISLCLKPSECFDTSDSSVQDNPVGGFVQSGDASSKAEQTPDILCTASSTVIQENVSRLLDDVTSQRSPGPYELLPKAHTETGVQEIDVGTPDDWIPRSSDLIRLTGAHPFNCEPPIAQLYDQGFVTPLSLQYVRNHGRSAMIEWADHRLSISGLVEKARTFTMDEILSMPSVTLPVTLVCAGNRRKELNMIKQTRGFHWGPAATSTSVWTGVRLTHLLSLCNVNVEKAKYVCFSGSENEMLPAGTFGASVGIVHALNDFSGIIIAYEQNGEPLHPDHGFPLRLIVPGWVGARMVKWLEKIEVSDKPTNSYYHERDNKIFPSFVDHELADTEGYWTKDEYLFNELNINSVIVTPCNMEVIRTSGNKTYTVRGYAYSGGGRKITRVELSLDGGRSWKLCNLSFPEEQFSSAPRFGLYFCWMFWRCTVGMGEMVECARNTGEFKCRAWDVSNNTQPAEHNWNLLGYGNNSHFSVKATLGKLVPPPGNATEEKPSSYLQFVHPTVAGPHSEGWMKQVGAGQSDELAKAAEDGSEDNLTVFSREQLAENDTRDSAWIVVDGRVYDTTSYLDDHPGGAASILTSAGKDASEMFNAIHSDTAKHMLKKYLIGKVGTSNIATADISAVVGGQSGFVHSNDHNGVKTEQVHSTKTGGSSTDDLISLDPNVWVSFELISRREISHDTRLFKFKLPSDKHRLGLAAGKHVLVRIMHDGKPLVRAYTPTSGEYERGSFLLCVKIYFSGMSSQNVQGSQAGKMTQFMETMKIGDSLSMTGPCGQVEYVENGLFLIEGKERRFAHVGLVCGGTGITPGFQVMLKIFENDDDKTTVSLIYANRTEGDILLRDRIDDMARRKGNIRVWYTLDKAPDNWDYDEGYVTEEMIREHIPKEADDTLVLLCGRPDMVEACLKITKEIGHKKENVGIF
ncbi:Nitrate reductase [NADH] 2 [Gracilariopsis chorda]|uniref:Nitrate reductase [NADH] 2 n=1 Tax=Gracilariopsis chorda TaxID=448386 RepID=A0A2V3IQS9_9FLOR|nr:Nitrate reductase [NADH] 2 [Gracilariopsis chorda]|eukprot:PXF44458.1 Nitrate reductase [NADH] 2 [Gracilariopsis chorda]